MEKIDAGASTTRSPRPVSTDNLALLFRDDLDPDVDIRFHAQHEDPRWLHVEVTNIERRSSLESNRTVVENTYRDVAVDGSRHAAEREIAAHAKPTFVVDRF